LSSPPRFRARLLDLRSWDELSQEMRRIEVDKGGIPIMAAKGVYRTILVEQVPTKAANIIKQEVLARGGDCATPWAAADFAWEHVDIVLMGSLTTYRSLIAKLYRQTVFHLREFADALQEVLIHTTPGWMPVPRAFAKQGLILAEEALEDLAGGRIPQESSVARVKGGPVLVPVGEHQWQFGRKTYVMGILNVTPDSFSDDGLDGDREAAWERAKWMAEAGADIIDVGGESSEARDHTPVAVQEEIDRVCWLIRRIRINLPGVLVSVDTWKAEVAEAAVEAGAQIINDVGAMRRDPAMRAVAAATGVPVVVMHDQKGTEYREIMGDIAAFFAAVIEDAEAAGVRREQLILDPGFGFGKTVHQDLLVTRRLRELTSLGRPLLHAPSRKRTIGRVLGFPTTVEERIFGTAATIAVGIMNGADIVRVHDVLDMVRCVRMTDALVRGYGGPDE
jgi:dihydropteroate synthase